MAARGLFLALVLSVAACSAVPPATPPTAGERPNFTQVGVASWYGRNHQGLKTAGGERFDMRKLTAAHRTLPLDTVVRVTNIDNQRTVKVRINDRGPYGKNRIIDLSSRAASVLGIGDDGTARVRLEVFASDQRGDG